jgi:hypothetical protein
VRPTEMTGRAIEGEQPMTIDVERVDYSDGSMP